METITVSGVDLFWKRRHFVVSRFCEFTAFGRPDVEQWLVNERTARKPDMGEDLHRCLRDHEGSYKGWDFYLWRMFYSNHQCKLFSNHTPLQVLRKYGATIEVNGEKHAKIYPQAWREQDLLTFLAVHAQNQAYCAGNRLFFDFGEPLGTLSLCFENQQGRVRYSRNIDPCEVAHSVRLNWEYNGNDITTTGPEARGFLCDCLEQEIKLEREKAEADFDTAVAVSEDGIKIVSADRVVISSRAGVIHLQLYDQDLFVEEKIVQSKNLTRWDRTINLGTEFTRESVISVLDDHIILDSFAHWQQYFPEVKMPDGSVERWLWCHIGEDSLPKGGGTPISR